MRTWAIYRLLYIFGAAPDSAGGVRIELRRLHYPSRKPMASVSRWAIIFAPRSRRHK